MKCLYIFVDESGNLDFSPKGTRYFVLSAISALTPIDSSSKLQRLKYELLAQGNGGNDHEYFHASEDRQTVRSRVFETINSMSTIGVNYIVAEKRKTHPDFQNAKFYGVLGFTLMKYLLQKYQKSEYQKIVVLFDQALPRKEQNNFLKQVKPLLKEVEKPYAIYFHRMISDGNGQIADYCAWAKFVSLEREEYRPLKEIDHIPKQTFDIFEKESIIYY